MLLVKEGELSELFRRERSAMVRLATLLLGSVHQAEEVVQDAFERVDERWSEIERPGAYLRTVVVNGCRRVLRQRDAERRYQRLEIVGDLEQFPTRLLELQVALGRLSERQRTVIVLRFFVDLPDAEIAEALLCRPSTVRSLTRRALRILRKELE
jgi:RNA polymerase sigma factor (sigma-70 family)